MRAAALLCLFILALGSACSKEKSPAAGPKKVVAVVTIFPLYDFCRQIGGDRVEVSLLLPPGVEAHSFEPKPDDIIRITRADLFIFTNRYMEPWAADILTGTGSRRTLPVDASAGVTLLHPTGEKSHGRQKGEGTPDGHNHDIDPHIWLSPANAATMVDNICAGLVRQNPANQSFFENNAAAFKKKLAALDLEFRDGLAGCRHRVFLHGGHFAFGYLAERYGLKYVSAFAVSANAEPTPEKLAEMIDLMKRDNLHYVFYEELFSPKMAETIARETGGTLLKLNSIDSLTREELAGGATYLSLMEQNLRNLKVGLECR
jgi:zinc transport system substrate-binding protein